MLSSPNALPVSRPSDRRWPTLAVLLIGTFMVLLDVGIVNVAIPTIQRSLGATTAQIQLVVASYQLAYAALLITGGRLGDLFGRKRMFMIGLGGFALTSALCGLALSPLMLVAARVLQGLTAALLYPQVASIIQVVFAPQERATAFGYFGATIGLGTIAGPLLGGLIVTANLANLGWRPIFLVNVPIGILGIIAASRLLSESYGDRGRKLDLPGVALVAAGLVLFIVPIAEGREAGWPAWAWASIAASLPVFALFVWYERRLLERGGSPLLDLRLFDDRSFGVGLLLSGAFFLGVTSFFFYTAIFLQKGLGFAPLHSALTLMPYQVTALFVSLISARVAARLGRGVLSLATALLALGMLTIAAVIGWRGADLTGPELILPLMLCGAGFGLFSGPSQAVILAGVQPANAGSAAGLLATVGQVRPPLACRPSAWWYSACSAATPREHHPPNSPRPWPSACRCWPRSTCSPSGSSCCCPGLRPPSAPWSPPPSERAGRRWRRWPSCATCGWSGRLRCGIMPPSMTHRV